MKTISLCCNSCQNYFRFEAGSFDDMRGTVYDACLEAEQEEISCSHEWRAVAAHPYEYCRCQNCGLVEAA